MYTRIVWCRAHVWNVWAISESFNFPMVSHLHELLQRVLPCYSWLKKECPWYCSKFVYQNSLMLCWCVKLLGKIYHVQFLSFIFNFALRNSKRRLKIEVLRYCLKFVYQNSLMLCSCVKRLGNIRVVQFSDGFSSSWTATTCSSMLFLIENWMSLILLKVCIPE